MKKFLLSLLAVLLLLPSPAAAAPISWDFAGGILQPLQSAVNAQIKGSFFTGTSTTATSTFPLLQATSAFKLASDYITDLTGSGLTISGNALTLDRTGAWTGTFDGQEGTYYLNRANHTGTETIAASSLNITGLSDGCVQIASNILTSTGAACGAGGSTYTATYPVTLTGSAFGLAFGTTTANTWSQLQTFTSGLAIGGETVTDLSGSGITVTGNALTLDRTGAWTGTFDGIEGSAYLDRANHTSTQLAATISDFSATARGLLSSSATGLTYTSGTGVFSLTAGYNIPLTASTTEWNTAYANRITSATSPLSIAANVISITADGIGDSQLAFNTGQNLTTASSPTFAGLTVGSGSGVLKVASGVVGVGADGTDYTLTNAITCTSGDFVSAVTAAGVSTCSTPSGGAPGGSNGQLQFNNSSSFGGASGLTWDSTNSRLGLGTASPSVPFHFLGTTLAPATAFATTTYSTAGTFTHTPNANTFKYKVYVWAGGGGGGGVTASGAAGSSGGGAGGYLYKDTYIATTSVQVIIGAGGVGNNGVATAAGGGGFSQFGGLFSTCGGGGGTGSSGGFGGAGGATAGTGASIGNTLAGGTGTCGVNPEASGTSGSGGAETGSVGTGGGSSAGMSGNGNNGTSGAITGGTGSGGALGGVNGSNQDSGGGGIGVDGAGPGGAGGSPGAGGGGADGVNDGNRPGGVGAAGKIIVVEEYYTATSTPRVRFDIGSVTALSVLSAGEVAVGTTTPSNSAFSVTNTGRRFVSLIQGLVGSVNYLFEMVDQYGHLIIDGPDPVVSSCGTGPTIKGSDRAGTITAGTGSVTACTITFSNAYEYTPGCIVSSSGASYAYVSAVSKTALTITTGVSVGAGKIYYQCYQPQHSE